MECGESLLAVRSAVIYRNDGPSFGLLENMGTLAEPNLYTHNVNLGGFFLIGAQILGVPDRYFFVAASLIFAVGLWYVYATFAYFIKRELAALIALVVFASTYWGLGAFGLNPLRAWHLVAFFAVFLHTSRIVSGSRTAGEILGLIFGALAAFGCGYDFWLICGCTAVTIVGLSPDCRWRKKIQIGLIVGVIFAVPFILRQIHVAMVLGSDYWVQDFIYSFAIKVPYADRFVHIPPLEEIDAYYKAQNVMRPPAQPGNPAWMILFTLRHMVEHITVPRWGLLSLGLTCFCFLVSLSPLFRTNPVVNLSYRIVLPMLLGPAIGLAALSPFALHVYFKHEMPLLAFPILASKALIIYFLARLLIAVRRNKFWWGTVAVCMSVIVLDAALVHWNNRNHSEYPTFGWANFYKKHPQRDFALSTYQLMFYAKPYIGAEQTADSYFPPEKILMGEEPVKPFWIYQPVDYYNDFDRTIPTCRWTGWLRQLLGTPFPHTAGKSCIYDQVFVPGAKAPPLSLDEVASRIKTYEVVERSDLGLGYLVMRKRGLGNQ